MLDFILAITALATKLHPQRTASVQEALEAMVGGQLGLARAGGGKGGGGVGVWGQRGREGAQLQLAWMGHGLRADYGVCVCVCRLAHGWHKTVAPLAPWCLVCCTALRCMPLLLPADRAGGPGCPLAQVTVHVLPRAATAALAEPDSHDSAVLQGDVLGALERWRSKLALLWDHYMDMQMRQQQREAGSASAGAAGAGGDVSASTSGAFQPAGSQLMADALQARVRNVCSARPGLAAMLSFVAHILLLHA